MTEEFREYYLGVMPHRVNYAGRGRVFFSFSYGHITEDGSGELNRSTFEFTRRLCPVTARRRIEQIRKGRLTSALE